MKTGKSIILRYRNTLYFSVDCLEVRWSNPVIGNMQWLQIADQLSGIEGVNGLMNIGNDPLNHLLFWFMQQGKIDTERAIYANVASLWS